MIGILANSATPDEKCGRDLQVKGIIAVARSPCGWRYAGEISSRLRAGSRGMITCEIDITQSNQILAARHEQLATSMTILVFRGAMTTSRAGRV